MTTTTLHVFHRIVTLLLPLPRIIGIGSKKGVFCHSLPLSAALLVTPLLMPLTPAKALASTIAINVVGPPPVPEGEARDAIVTVTNVSDFPVHIQAVAPSIDFAHIMFDQSDFIRAVNNIFSCDGETLGVNQKCTADFSLQSVALDGENNDFGDTTITFTATPDIGEPVTQTIVVRVTDPSAVPEPGTATLILFGIGVAIWAAEVRRRKMSSGHQPPNG
jgi:hypothetical protein